MTKTIKIKKGLDIPLAGKPSEIVTNDDNNRLYAIFPDDFLGPVWKACVKAGDKIKAGDPLFMDKASESIYLVSPVTGEVKEVNRGERRHINFISVERTGEDKKLIDFEGDKTSEEIKKILKESGLWCMLRQRPYDIVPEIDSEPRDIFVTAFDTSPLAGELIDSDLKKWLDNGLEILKQLTKGQIYLSVRKGSGLISKIAETVEFEGPHPAGNVGTQIAAIKPVNKGETVWTTDANTVSRIGKLFSNGELDFHTLVAVTGPVVKNPHLVKTLIGASIQPILKGFTEVTDGLRIISGNVLTGIQVKPNGFLRYPYRQITIIEEGDQADEFMGWASLNPKKYSVKRSFPAFLRGLSKPFDFDARVKGGKRAMILSGEYDKVFPFDIYPEYLLKAIIAGDIDRMEKLGIYEVAPEDFALPEFVDTSKTELQKIVREGLNNLRKELS